LNWNGKDDTAECIDSLGSIAYPDHELLLVDNGSTDGSVEYLTGRFPGLKVLETGANLGYAGGNNRGIKAALEQGADYVLLLNNDTIVSPDFLDGLVKVAEGDERIGMVGPKICFYSDPRKIWSAGGNINMFTGDVGNVGEGLPQGALSGVRTVDYVSGCALMIKAEVLKKTGLMDEDYFLYYEEADLNVMAHRHGYISVVNCDVSILHKVGASSKIKGYGYYFVCRNLPRFIVKNGRWYHKATFFPIFFLRYTLAYFLHIARGNREISRNILLGVGDFLHKKYGKRSAP
jgi:GT2 family glycosyltransferase